MVTLLESLSEMGFKTSKPVTLSIIADRASVSVSTVSLCLRNHPSIPECTRARIQKIAKDLGYRPNAMVAALMASIHTRRPVSEPPVLGLLLDEGFSSKYKQVPFYRELVEGVRERALQLGYQAETMEMHPGEVAARGLHRTLHARSIRGVIVMPLTGQLECLLTFEGMASCSVGYTLHKPALHRVVPNYSQGMRLAWSKLMERGYRRPGFISTKSHLASTYYERYAAFIAQQAIHPEIVGIPPLILSKVPEDRVKESTILFRKWLGEYRPDVLIFPPWGMLKKMGETVSIPDEVGVILSDVEPGWCMVKEDAHEIGAGAVDLVVAQIHRNETGLPSNPKLMAIDNHWVEGFSLPAR